jgi:prevent-host-death family protein
MITYSITEARKNFKKIMDLVDIEKKHVFITKYGKIVAVIVPIEDAEKHLYSVENGDFIVG